MTITPRWMEEAHQARSRRHHLLVALLGAAVGQAPDKRAAHCVLRSRLDWDVHKQTLLLEGQFKRCYRMDVESFERLLRINRPALLRDEVQSTLRTGMGPITSENMLQMTISWLAGSNYHTTRGLAGISVSGIYGVMHDVMDAIIACPELRIRSPTESKEHMMETADDFTSISKYGILTGCVGCVDGWLCQIRAPSSNEVPGVAAFFPGHYQMYGLNVQAICDAYSRFTGYCINSPGKVGDSIAVKKWALSKEIMELPHGFYIVGDNAYPLSNSQLVPFTKLELKSKAHSDYNFYLGQLRIRIEMAFGLLVNKWQIFKRPLVVDFVKVRKVVKTCMKIHNFCINERLKDKDATSGMHAVSMEYHALPESSYQTTENTDEGDILRPDVQGRILCEVIAATSRTLTCGGLAHAATSGYH
ncbi:hypothetical protein PF011_g15270 [Phytophthora fragariae]|uniref:DDE Tnp4 domain-containing protein n=1 Tax=Phytophthora fragariae TaxID=53985 RepID=A0A6A3JSP6_9STRA|nr:hypothetical protein PF011_g15270 [Phytophthora fragariae]